jgi:hypothetical protein
LPRVEEFLSVENRQTKIKDDDVWWGAAHEIQCSEAISCNRNSIASGLQGVG